VAVALRLLPTQWRNSRGDVADLKTAILKSVMGQFEERYAYSKNPIHLWQMYLFTRQTGLPIPETVGAYLDRVAKAITGPNPPTSPAMIATALGLATKGGPSPARQAATTARDLNIVARVASLYYLGNHPPVPYVDPEDLLDLKDLMGVFERVAQEFQLSSERVKSIFYRELRRDRAEPSDAADPADTKSLNRPVRRPANLGDRDPGRRRRKNSRSS
jgi:hypothetical protein